MLLDDPAKAEEVFNYLMTKSAIKGQCRVCHNETKYEVKWRPGLPSSCSLASDSKNFIKGLLDYFLNSQYKTTTFISKGSKSTSLLWFWFCSPECLRKFYEEIFPLILYRASNKNS